MSSDTTSALSEILSRLTHSPTDEDAWSSLYRQMWPFVFAIVCRRLRGVGDMAEDASQEVFLRLARARPFKKLQSSEEFRAYLWTVANNVARTYLRYYLQRQETELGDPSSATTALGDQISDANPDVELRDTLRTILKELGPTDRQLIHLLAQGHNLPKIAKTTGLSYPNAAVRVHRLRRKLRKYLILKDLLV